MGLRPSSPKTHGPDPTTASQLGMEHVGHVAEIRVGRRSLSGHMLSSTAFDSTQSYRADFWDPETPSADGPFVTTDALADDGMGGLLLTIPAGIFAAQGRLDLFVHVYPYD